MVESSENSTGPKANEKIDRLISEYFSVNPEEIMAWTHKEVESLLEISEDILDWSPGEEGNVFLINSYEEKKRNRAAAFIAREVGHKRIWPVFITEAGQLGKTLREAEGTSREFAFFISLSEKGSLSEKNLSKILMRLGSRKFKDIPIILALPDRYNSIFEHEEDEIKISYPQNSTSRAFIMLGIAILVMPLFNFPYMHLPLSNNLMINDAGMIELTLFLYSMILFVASRKKISRKQSYSILLSVILYITSVFVATNLVYPYLHNLTPFTPVTRLPVVSYPPAWTQNIVNAASFTAPVLLKLISFAILPLSFMQKKRRFTLAMLALSTIIIYLSVLFFTSSPIYQLFVNYFVPNYSYFPPLDTFYIYPGNLIFELVAGVPVAIMFFADYVRTSFSLKEKFYEPRGPISAEPEPA